MYKFSTHNHGKHTFAYQRYLLLMCDFLSRTYSSLCILYHFELIFDSVLTSFHCVLMKPEWASYQSIWPNRAFVSYLNHMNILRPQNVIASRTQEKVICFIQGVITVINTFLQCLTCFHNSAAILCTALSQPFISVTHGTVLQKKTRTITFIGLNTYFMKSIHSRFPSHFHQNYIYLLPL